MFNVILNAIIIVMWSWIGYMTVKPKMRRMREAKDGYAQKVHKGELIQYALVYIMMMLLLVEKTIEAIMSM